MNSVNLIGRLTKDPDLQTTSTGMNVCRFTLAVNRARAKDGNGPTADFIMCKAFGKTAEVIARRLSKGRQIGVTGRIQTGSYDNQQGQRVYTTDVIVDQMTFADSNPNGSAQNSGYQKPQQSYQQPQQQNPAGFSWDGIEVNTDDLPF